MFEPFINISDKFRYVIDQLPCCELDDAEIAEKYIHDYILEYFGYSYVSTLMLGGVALQNIFIDSSNASSLEQKGIDKKHEAQVEFFGKFHVKDNNINDDEKHKIFMKSVKEFYSTFLGGDPSLSSMEDWSKTVKNGPVIIKFGIKYIFDLLNKRRFPDDSQIDNKSKLIERVLNSYIASPTYCYGNCSGNGVCVDTGYFQFGTCKCKDGWSGIDCSVPITRPSVLAGTLCGHQSTVTCDGAYPNSFCPTNWQQTRNPLMTLLAPWTQSFGVPLVSHTVIKSEAS